METFDIKELTTVSSLDGSREKLLFHHPGGAERVPLVVGLHTWSYDRFNQLEGMLPHCTERGWALLLPEFRGPNLDSNPRARQACASPLAIQDVFDGVERVAAEYPIDEEKLFVLGGSGGGHMALMLAARAPKRWRGVSSWVPITDLAAWHRENPDYARHVSACCGGPPGSGGVIDREYRERSPLSYASALATATLSVHHGRFDPVVPYSHTWKLALELERLGARRFFFEVFDGGHDIHYEVAFRWFENLLGKGAGDDEHLSG